jgi:hypothetical protein
MSRPGSRERGKEAKKQEWMTMTPTKDEEISTIIIIG